MMNDFAPLFQFNYFKRHTTIRDAPCVPFKSSIDAVPPFLRDIQGMLDPPEISMWIQIQA